MILYLIHTKGLSIYEQLCLEEQLLRKDIRNFFLINEGCPPAVVMGISGKINELVDTKKTKLHGYPIIKRFSGGGTVIVDEDTLFTSFICNKDIFNFPAYPERIMKWSESIYKDAFGIPSFSLCENDFVIGKKKCGGNAQYITKDRWIQHTSFLWNFSPIKMDCLLHPIKTPHYRESRSHEDFLCCIKDYIENKELFIEGIKTYLRKKFQIVSLPYLASKPQITELDRISSTFVSC